MVSFGEKAKIKKAENLNQGRSYVITTVSIDILFCLLNNKLIFQNFYVHMNYISFMWLSLLNIYKILYFLQKYFILFFLQK